MHYVCIGPATGIESHKTNSESVMRMSRAVFCLTCRYMLQLSTPASDADSAAADLVPLLETLLQISPEMQRVLTSSGASSEGQAKLPDLSTDTPAPSAAPDAGMPGAHHHHHQSQNLGAHVPALLPAAPSTPLDQRAGGATSDASARYRPQDSATTASSSDASMQDAPTDRSNLDPAAQDAAASATPAAAAAPAPASSNNASDGIESGSNGGHNVSTNSSQPSCLFAACWTQHVPSQDNFNLPQNVALCGCPDAQISFDAAIRDVDSIIDRLYGAGSVIAWASNQQLQDDESDDEAVEALSHALGETSTGV